MSAHNVERKVNNVKHNLVYFFSAIYRTVPGRKRTGVPNGGQPGSTEVNWGQQRSIGIHRVQPGSTEVSRGKRRSAGVNGGYPGSTEVIRGQRRSAGVNGGQPGSPWSTNRHGEVLPLFRACFYSLSSLQAGLRTFSPNSCIPVLIFMANLTLTALWKKITGFLHRSNLYSTMFNSLLGGKKEHLHFCIFPSVANLPKFRPHHA